MKLSVRLSGAVVAALVLAAPAPAQVKNAVEWLPAETLAYLEVHQPARLAREVAALVKGSALEDMAATMSKFRAPADGNDDFGPRWATVVYGVFGLFVCPEMLAEAARFDGAVVAVTGVNKNGPEIVTILFPGTSNLPGLYTRAFAMISGEARSGAVEGVPVYRTMSYNFAPMGGGPRRVESDPSYALLPNALVIGTYNAVKDVVRRSKRKSGDPDLSSSLLYRNLSKGREQAGLYGFADLAGLSAQIDAVLKENKSPARDWQAFTTLVNPRAVRHLTAALTLQDGNLKLSARVQLDAKQTSPLLDALPDRKAGTDWLHAVPKDAVLSLGLSPGDGAARWEKILAAANTFAKEEGAGGGELPANLVRALEEQLKLQLGPDLFGKLSHVALALEPQGFRPLLIGTTTDEKAAQFLQEEALPRLATLASPEQPAKPTDEKVLEQKVQWLPLPPSLFGMDRLYSGRDGTTLVVGFDGKAVATALLSASRKEGLGADKGLAAALKELDGPVVAGTASLGQALVGLLRELEHPPAVTPAPPGPDGKLVKPAAEEAKAVKELQRAVEELPPAVLALARKPDALVLEVQQRDLRKAAAKLITVWVEAGLERSVRPGRSGRPEVKPAPAEEKKPE
jgi:hypothetical protein